ncbi:hypothetical protein HP499_11755 [Paenarthrobacter sp. CM16]|nr:hypothetical protein [Paenarthrobacter sp. CM16]
MMRTTVVLLEAWRNLQSGTSKGGWLSVALIMAISLVSCAELWTVSALDNRAHDYRTAGASIRVLKVEAGIDPKQCDALSGTSGILSAGAMKAVAPIHILSLPGVSTPAFETTLGFQEVLGLGTALESGVFISEPLANRWKIRHGDILESDQGPLPVAAVFPYPEDDGRDSRLANAVLLPSLGSGPSDECWADVWPSTAGFDSVIRTSQGTAQGEASASVSTLNPTLGLVFTGADEYQNRVTRYAAAISACLGFAIGLLGGARRRLEYASSLHAGVTSGDLARITLVEATIWAGAAGAVATAGVVLGAHFWAPLIADALYTQFLTIGMLSGLGAITGSLFIATHSRESRLFVYFRERS